MINLLKKIIKLIPIAFTQNQKYDFQTKQIIKKICTENSNCIDIGCHKGEVLDIILKYSPNGFHYAFEPIPEMYKKLKMKYKGSNISVFEIALSNKIGEASFNYVVSNPAYSGLIKRKYDKDNEIDTQILVETNKLDNIIPKNIKIDLVKIDVEGGELQVLEGSIDIIKKNKPIIIFEHGLGASEFYDSTPEKVYSLLNDCGMKISTMQKYLQDKTYFSMDEFKSQFYNKTNYYFIAF